MLSMPLSTILLRQDIPLARESTATPDAFPEQTAPAFRCPYAVLCCLLHKLLVFTLTLIRDCTGILTRDDTVCIAKQACTIVCSANAYDFLLSLCRSPQLLYELNYNIVNTFAYSLSHLRMHAHVSTLRQSACQCNGALSLRLRLR